MVTFRRGFRGANVGGLVRSAASRLGIFKYLSVAASFLLLSAASAQAASNIDAAIQEFQAEGVRLIGVVGTVGIAVIGAGILMTLGWAMLRKVQGGK